MRNIFRFRVAGIAIMLVTIAIFGLVVMLLWNVLMPGLFWFPVLNYWQAAGLLLLVRILAGGLGHGFAHDGRRGGVSFFHGHGNKLREKWMNMSEDERRDFIRKQRDFSGFRDRFSGFDRFSDDRERDNDESDKKEDDHE